MEYVVLSPTWVWIFDAERNRGVQELYGDEAKELIEKLEKEPPAKAIQQEGQPQGPEI